MINIEMHGLLEENARQVGEEIWRQVITTVRPEEIDNWVVTCVSSRSYNNKGLNAPFLRVYSDDTMEIDNILKVLLPIKLPGVTGEKRIELVHLLLSGIL
jgi:hypothetical protein